MLKLTNVSGIGEGTIEKLKDGGIESIEEITIDSLTSINGIGKKTAEKIVDAKNEFKDKGGDFITMGDNSMFGKVKVIKNIRNKAGTRIRLIETKNEKRGIVVDEFENVVSYKDTRATYNRIEVAHGKRAKYSGKLYFQAESKDKAGGYVGFGIGLGDCKYKISSYIRSNGLRNKIKNAFMASVEDLCKELLA